MWALRHQAGSQHTAVKRAMAKVAIRNIVAPAPQPEPAMRLKSTTRDVKFLRSDSRCQRYVSDQQWELYPKIGNCGPQAHVSSWTGLLALVYAMHIFRMFLMFLCWWSTIYPLYTALLSDWSVSHSSPLAHLRERNLRTRYWGAFTLQGLKRFASWAWPMVLRKLGNRWK